MPGTNNKPVVKVLLVCLGNICRSPTAHGVLQHRIDNSSMQGRIQVDSAGTGNWHIGESPDARSTKAAGARGYNLEDLRARQVQASDFHEFDYILAMDRDNLADLQANCPAGCEEKLELFLAYSSGKEEAVPDPYYSGPDGFELVLDMVEEASDKLIQALISRHFSP